MLSAPAGISAAKQCCIPLCRCEPCAESGGGTAYRRLARGTSIPSRPSGSVRIDPVAARAADRRPISTQISQGSQSHGEHHKPSRLAAPARHGHAGHSARGRDGATQCRRHRRHSVWPRSRVDHPGRCRGHRSVDPAIATVARFGAAGLTARGGCITNGQVHPRSAAHLITRPFRRCRSATRRRWHATCL